MENVHIRHMKTVALLEALDTRTTGLLKQEDGNYISSVKEFFRNNIIHVVQDVIDGFNDNMTNRLVTKANIKNLNNLKPRVRELGNTRFSKYESVIFPVIIGMNVNHLEFTTKALKLGNYIKNGSDIIDKLNIDMCDLISDINGNSLKLKIPKNDVTHTVKWNMDSFLTDCIGVNNNIDKQPFSKLFDNMRSIETVRVNYLNLNKMLLEDDITTFNAKVLELQENIETWLSYKSNSRHSKEVIRDIKNRVTDVANIISLTGMITHLLIDNTSYYVNTINDLK